MAAEQRMELRIFGRVQGVAFRWYAQSAARGLGLTGWVRNRADGSVQLMAEGSSSALDDLRRWAERGPGQARVDRIEENRSEAAGTCTGFEIYG
ncbi:acylphosphatase [bacterium]|nr:acylphosphatase [bacterium]PIV80634.1 MAG: acylphosphatase [bacterium CG17_big_fil_post_rev_8_21_14_2_50_64_8]PJA76417.1 MAG: acylphosphatase [bacterium CG_4_9_14_3_um_filter_65_15]